MSSQEETNKALIVKFMTTILRKKDAVEAAEFITESYIQHSPEGRTGKAGFLQTIPTIFVDFPELTFEIKHLWADGDYVIVHSHYKFNAGDRGTAIVDMFRIEDGKVAEHWDVAQEIPEKMNHDNGMF